MAHLVQAFSTPFAHSEPVGGCICMLQLNWTKSNCLTLNCYLSNKRTKLQDKLITIYVASSEVHRRLCGAYGDWAELDRMLATAKIWSVAGRVP